MLRTFIFISYVVTQYLISAVVLQLDWIFPDETHIIPLGNSYVPARDPNLSDAELRIAFHDVPDSHYAHVLHALAETDFSVPDPTFAIYSAYRERRIPG